MPKQKPTPKPKDDAELDEPAAPETDEETEEAETPPAKPVRSNGKAKAKPGKKSDEPVVKAVNVRVEKPKPSGNRHLMLYGGIGLGVIVVVVVLGALLMKEPPAPAPTNTETPVVKVEDAARLMDGTPVGQASANRWPMAVMLDNLPPARPQSALGLARIVYETMAEGGATRFMALFDGSENPSRVGPVRSARHYFVNLAEEYKAAYVHAGQSPQAADALRKSTVTDLNLIGSAAKYGYRVADRPAPHNLYTDDTKLTYAMRDKKLLERPAEYTSWPFTPEPGLDLRPTTSMRLVIAFSNKSFEAEWLYDRVQNVFQRSTGGTPHVDALNNQQIVAKNVVVVHVPAEKSLVEKGRIDITITGRGKAEVYKDGAVVAGEWVKPTLQDRIQFVDASGVAIPFHPGPIWLEVVPGDRQVMVYSGVSNS